MGRYQNPWSEGGEYYSSWEANSWGGEQGSAIGQEPPDKQIEIDVECPSGVGIFDPGGGSVVCGLKDIVNLGPCTIVMDALADETLLATKAIQPKEIVKRWEFPMGVTVVSFYCDGDCAGKVKIRFRVMPCLIA